MQIRDHILSNIASIVSTVALGIGTWLVAMLRSRVSKHELDATAAILEKRLGEMDGAHKELRQDLDKRFYSRLIIDDMLKNQDAKIDDIRDDIQRLESNLASSIECLPDEIVAKLKKYLGEQNDTSRSRD